MMNASFEGQELQSSGGGREREPEAGSGRRTAGVGVTMKQEHSAGPELNRHLYPCEEDRVTTSPPRDAPSIVGGSLWGANEALSDAARRLTIRLIRIPPDEVSLRGVDGAGYVTGSAYNSPSNNVRRSIGPILLLCNWTRLRVILETSAIPSWWCAPRNKMCCSR